MKQVTIGLVGLLVDRKKHSKTCIADLHPAVRGNPVSNTKDLMRDHSHGHSRAQIKANCS